MCGEGGCHISLCVQCGANEKVKLATGLWLTGLNMSVNENSSLGRRELGIGLKLFGTQSQWLFIVNRSKF